MTSIKWAELHSPLFLAGANLGAKLDPTKKTGLSMEYHEEKRHLYVGYNGHTARVPEPSILSMVEGIIAPRVHAQTVPTGVPIKAQVSTPQDHVFSGGPGKFNNK